ncbi:MAG: hypothetical protein KC448_01225 [Yoonia sp.]|nr:hypothetical protein [Yoonia sp.]
MEISVQNQTNVPHPLKPSGQVAATANASSEARQPDLVQAAQIPEQLGVTGALNEAKAGVLEAGKIEPNLFYRTLKPYDTVMLPYRAADEKRLHQIL